jgi:hypothetical protein
MAYLDLDEKEPDLAVTPAEAEISAPPSSDGDQLSLF